MRNIFMQKFLALVLTIVALAVGQSAWVTTKTVTYKMLLALDFRQFANR